MIAALAFAAVATASSGDLQHLARQPRTGGLIDVSDFNDKAMVRAVAGSPCVADNFSKWPEDGCLRAAQHKPGRK